MGHLKLGTRNQKLESRRRGDAEVGATSSGSPNSLCELCGEVFFLISRHGESLTWFPEFVVAEATGWKPVFHLRRDGLQNGTRQSASLQEFS